MFTLSENMLVYISELKELKTRHQLVQKSLKHKLYACKFRPHQMKTVGEIIWKIHRENVMEGVVPCLYLPSGQRYWFPCGWKIIKITMNTLFRV